MRRLGTRRGFSRHRRREDDEPDAVRDQQVDWDTLDEHKEKYDADYVVLVAPAFGGQRFENVPGGPPRRPARRLRPVVARRPRASAARARCVSLHVRIPSAAADVETATCWTSTRERPRDRLSAHAVPTARRGDRRGRRGEASPVEAHLRGAGDAMGEGPPRRQHGVPRPASALRTCSPRRNVGLLVCACSSMASTRSIRESSWPFSASEARAPRVASTRLSTRSSGGSPPSGRRDPAGVVQRAAGGRAMRREPSRAAKASTPPPTCA